MCSCVYVCLFVFVCVCVCVCVCVGVCRCVGVGCGSVQLCDNLEFSTCVRYCMVGILRSDSWLIMNVWNWLRDLSCSEGDT